MIGTVFTESFNSSLSFLKGFKSVSLFAFSERDCSLKPLIGMFPCWRGILRLGEQLSELEVMIKFDSVPSLLSLPWSVSEASSFRTSGLA